MLSRIPAPQLIEILALIPISLLLASQTGRRLIGRVKRSRAVRCLVRRPSYAIGVAFAISLVLSATVSLLRPPIPKVHDEFSYLLAGDTFAQGRLANPSHPMWVHLETFHVLHQPTYASKFPPGQGLILAVGQVLTGMPIVGVWLATAVAVACASWMLLQWLPGRAALVGSLLVIAFPQLGLMWGQSYGGSALTFAGAALLFGALPRAFRRPHWSTGVALAAGATLLANTRPYSGAICCLVVGGTLLVRLIQATPGLRRDAVRQVLLPATALAALSGLWIIVYNYHVTGSFWRLPYSLHHQQYGATPLFLLQSAWQPRDYRHSTLFDFYDTYASAAYRTQNTLRAITLVKGQMLAKLALQWLGISLGCCLLALPWAPRGRLLFPLLAVSAVIIGSLPVPWVHPRYLAVAAPLVLLLATTATTQLARWRPGGRRIGLQLATVACAVYVATFGVRMVIKAVRKPTGWEARRAELVRGLLQRPGKDLVLVRYSARHSILQEWVFNAADIDGSEIVWARTMNEAQDRRLCQYFSDRRVWLLEPDRTPLLLAELPQEPAKQKSSVAQNSPTSNKPRHSLQ